MSLVQYHLTIDKKSKVVRSLILSVFVPVLLAMFFIVAQPVMADSTRPLSELNQLILNLASQLRQNLHAKHSSGKILVVNFVDLSQLGCTSRFGQLLAERLRNLLTQEGWQVLEARRGDRVKIEEDKGPYILSDQIRDLAKKIQCGSVLLGTYLFHQGTITVNAKLVAVPDNSILSAATTEANCTPYIFALLKPVGFGCRAPEAFIRIKPFSESHIFRDEPDTAFVRENYFKEETL